jgi:membrane-associated protein
LLQTTVFVLSSFLALGGAPCYIPPARSALVDPNSRWKELEMAELFDLFREMFTNLPVFLNNMIATFGWVTYLILFLIVFCETGLVVTPILPGDSLLFAAGTFTIMRGTDEAALSAPLLVLVLSVAAILGDAVNYSVGHFIGPKIFHKENVRFLNKEHLAKAHAFYEKHGGKTIILARFMPIIRTFAPFVAGIGRMTYLHFASFNVIGGVAWVSVCVYAGHFLADVEFVKKHFEMVLIAIVFISVLPALVEYARHRLAVRRARG